jgi:hypothetical protein
MQQVKFDKRYSVCTIEIKRDEDWRDGVMLKRLLSDGSIASFDFSEIDRFDLYIRPVFDHGILIYRLSSPVADGNAIQFDPAMPGRLDFVVGRDDIIAWIPTGKWDQFLVATYVSGVTEEFWRGPLFVHPGKISA